MRRYYSKAYFWNFGRKRTELSIDTSLRSFLLRAVRHDCYDAIKHRRIVESHIAYVLECSTATNWDVDHYVSYSELETQIKYIVGTI